MVLTLGTVLNGLRLRQRLSGLGRLDATEPAAPGVANDDDDFVLVRAAGVEVDDGTRGAAAAHARADGLDVLDLVPGDLPLAPMLDLARVVDTTSYRSDALAAGRGGRHALLVRRDVWNRMTSTGDSATVGDGAWLVRLTERLKQHAARSTDLTVAPGLHAVEPPTDERLAQLKAVYSGAFPLAVAIPGARSALLAAGLAVAPGWGAAAAAAFVLQPLLVSSGGPIRPSGSPGAAAVRAWTEPFLMARSALTGRKGSDTTGAEPDPVESRRPIYTELMAAGIDGFFEDRRDTCPMCGSADLKERIRIPDWIQFKPGEFVLEMCQSCSHIFQNPRLSRDGLNFYYRDFYDGLGAGGVEFLFAQGGSSYRGRVEMVRRHVTPRSWLDVGSGYGHFCLIAKGVLPDTLFDGLDMGESIEEADRRRWVDNAYRGLFPDLADQLAGRYDVVSMHHYLEHTIDPMGELEAAARVLPPGGHLLIEVPDPESRFARLMGRAWIPWIQPQHLHFIPVANLQAALESRGFTVVDIERGPAHQAVDLAAGLLMRVGAVAPPARLPWRDPPTAGGRAFRAFVLSAVAPLAALAMVADRVLRPVIATKAQGWSNTYRLLARRN